VHTRTPGQPVAQGRQPRRWPAQAGFAPVGAIPEVFEEDRDVLFVPPGDHPALADVISRLMTGHTLLQRLSDEGIARFRRQFALDVFISNLFAIYRRRFGLAIEPARRPEPAGLHHV